MVIMMAEAQTWLGSSGETVKRLDSSNGSNKTTAVATAEVQTGLDGDSSDNMIATAAAQAWLVIRRRQQQDNSYCGRNGGGANLDWIGVSGKTTRQKQKQRQDGSDSRDGGGA